MTMTITPFPPRELAKLVLGYLAEEQLMTAYDEFLQSSPYLDALENEHDRVFMTPLRNIVAEFRALKIYVETCKPFTLRRRLMGCANLLEAVKLLVYLVDTNKISCQEHGASRPGHDSVNMKTYSRIKSVCDVCSSLNRSSCACHILSKSNASVEATLLEDLPGHHGRKKHVKVLDKEKSSSASSNEQLSLIVRNAQDSSSGSLDQDVIIVDSQTLRHDDCNSDGQSQNTHSFRKESNANQKTDVIHKTVSNVSNSSQHKSCLSSGRAGQPSPATSFQDFAAGVEGKNTVPDSSTSETLNSVIPVITKDTGTNSVSKKGVTKAHIVLKVERNKSSGASETSVESPMVTAADLKGNHSVRPKPTDQKITILSDIKVDKGYQQGEAPTVPRPPAVLRHASTPRALHSVLINGTRAFTRDPGAHAHAYSRDEIMAMPTIILVPASAAGHPHRSNSFPVQAPNTETTSSTNTISSTARSLGPLLIDVESSDSSKTQIEVQTTESSAKLEKPPDTLKNVKNISEVQNYSQSPVKTAEFKNATVPKDVEASNKSTPVSVPLPRKSSSTPRRCGHVRVLDFTTPRRILGDPIAEHPPVEPETPMQNPPCKPVDVNSSNTPIIYTVVNPKETSDSDKNTLPKFDSSNKNDEFAIASQSIQKIITVKKSDWDADLRALAVANAKMETPKAKSDTLKRKVKSDTPKSKATRRKKGSENMRDVEKSQETKNSKRKSNVTKSTTKIKFKSLEVIEDTVEIVDSSPPAVAVKPTINVITEHDWGIIPVPDDSDKNKPNNDDETDTPETERLCLQNAIGAKLNISDLLETPYKQVLYDIQMETPRFLGPDLPGDPMSDIKIMNIPTPRFLATPKPVQATPSSYSSRQTDYSSSSSYYKPDDHDCIDIGYPVLPAMETPPESNEVSKNKSKEKIFKSSRPVRKCTKNVSYVNSPNIKVKEGDKDDESVNDESGLNESTQPTKDLKSKTPKAEKRRKSIGIKKRKTPVKKETPKSFMKIKPRRPTPVKDTFRKRTQSGTSGRKRTPSKAKVDSVTPELALVSAPTKSRRKSSTPRKLHCTKQFHSESSDHESPETVDENRVPTRTSSASGEAPPLHWSDEGTQDSAPTENQTKVTNSHTKVTDNNAKHTESYTKPSDNPTKPSDSQVRLTDSNTKPTDSHTKPTDNHTKSTENYTKFKDNRSKLTESRTKPISSHTKSTESHTKATDIHTKPTESHTKLTDNYNKLKDSRSKPTDSDTKPTESDTKPADSHTHLTSSHSKLTDRNIKLTGSHTKPTDCHTKPKDSHTKPTDSHTKPSCSNTKSIENHNNLTDSHTKSTESHIKHSDSNTKSTESHIKHSDSNTKSTESHTKPTVSDTKSTDSHTKPAEEKNTSSTKPRLGSVNDTEDITKIQEYLAESETDKFLKVPEGRESLLHIDLVRRGFDIETAKIIERDLLDTPPCPKENQTTSNEPLVVEASKDNKFEWSVRERRESANSSFVDVERNDEEDEIELSVHECNEDSKNYIICHHDDIKDIPRKAPEKLKDKYSMEICIDDDVAIRLRATPLTFLIDEDPKDVERLEYNRETEMAVSSISGMTKLYTPLKDQRAQCYEIFDSTLTSLDTPMKLDTPKRRDPEMTVTEIVLEVEKVDVKEKEGEKNKRKRALSGNASDESTNENKKPKPDPQYLLNPANIKNIDIETVLCKLHGP